MLSLREIRNDMIEKGWFDNHGDAAEFIYKLGIFLADPHKQRRPPMPIKSKRPTVIALSEDELEFKAKWMVRKFEDNEDEEDE